MKKLLAVDGWNIVRRLYEASDESGEAARVERTVRYALSTFSKLLACHRPTHVLAAFDAAAPTWRHALHPAYRQSRTPTPVALQSALPMAREKLAAMGVHTICIAGVEADDVIATVVLRWLQEKRGDAVVVSTGKDLHALVAHGAMLWDHFKSEWHDAQWVEAKFGVPPALLPDLFALVGDVPDGIPGVTKIGLKTAARLLQSYGSVDGVMAGAGILKDALGERLRKEREQLALSQQLVALKTDVRLGVTWNTLSYTGSL
jgi:DNA polymerase-1